MLLENNQSNLLSTKGKNRFTYYIPSSSFKSKYMKSVDNEGDKGLSTKLSALPTKLSAPPQEKIKEFNKIKKEIDKLPKRVNDKEVFKNLIVKLCSIQSFKISELAVILNKSEKYLLRDFIRPLLKENKIMYLYPDMINHPEQAYKTKK